METLLNDHLAVHESRKSEKILYFVTGERIYERVSKKHATRIIRASNNNYLWGLYETQSGLLRATFI